MAIHLGLSWGEDAVVQAEAGIPLDEEESRKFYANADAIAVVPAVDAVAYHMPVVAQAAGEGKATPSAGREIYV